MKRLTQSGAAFGAAFTLTAALAVIAPAGAETVHPAKMDSEDQTGKIFENPGTVVTQTGDDYILDFTSMLSSDGRFASGMYTAPASRSEINEPYGVDEFMYFLEGGVTLTSSDGTVTEIEAGDAVTIPKEWTGVWETDGYRKIWVIYSEDGSALE